jgi:hypothetical protein
VRRVFHRHRAAAGEELAQPGVEFDPAGVLERAAGQVREGALLDLVDEGPRLALRRHEIEPAARGHVPGAGQAGDPPRDGIRAVEIVEQPAVEAGCAKGRLYGGYVKGHTDFEYSWFGAVRPGHPRPPADAATS